MKLNYYILWVEDDDSWFETTSELFKENIEDLGFSSIIERKISLDTVAEEIAKNNLKKYDILLIDFNLRNSTSGDTIIDLIRVKEVFTDILFYSSDKAQIIESLTTNFFEGVYYSDRKELETKFEKVFKTTIKKIEEINSMRGLIVGETSELDGIIDDCLSSWLVEPLLNNYNVDAFITEKIFKKTEKNIAFLKAEFAEKSIFGILPHCDAIRKWELLRAILKANKKHNVFIDEFLKTNSSYQDEVIGIRNKFAHAQVVTNEDGKELLKAHTGTGHLEFNEDSFKSIRSNLLKHRSTLIKLKNL